MIIFFSTEFFQVRPDLCATDCPKGPRSFLGKFWTDSLVHDDNAIKLLVDVIGNVSFFFRRGHLWILDSILFENYRIV